MPSHAAVTLTIDPAGGQQDGVEFDVVTGSGLVSMADMQNAVTNATPGQAGVFDMSDMTGSTNRLIKDTDDSTFGVITNATVGTDATRGEILATSGINHTWVYDATTFTFDLGSTGSAGVTAFGFVNTYWRSGAALVNETTVTANFSGGSSASINSDAAEAFLVTNPGTANGTFDQWFGFAAPTGETIISVEMTEENATGQWAAVDDMAFVLEPTTSIPEQSSTALLGLGAVALILRRRK